MKRCSECGKIYPRGGDMCCMSPDGEGPHQWEGVEEEIASQEMQRISEHLEQGSSEID